MKSPVTIDEIEQHLRLLPPEKLESVYDFVSCLLERERVELFGPAGHDAIQTMFASEKILRRDWDRPEEDDAWVDL